VTAAAIRAHRTAQRTARGRSRRGVDRTREVATAALAAFCDGGFRLTQIAHVAERLGISVGAIYRYVDSKEALFHLAVLEALGEAPETLDAPLQVTGIAESAQRLRAASAGDSLWSRLEAALASPAPADAAAEAREIAEQLYASLSLRAPVIRLLDRCAHEIPELAEIFDREVRATLMADLTAWVVKRGFADEAATPSAAVLARGALETIAWLAKTRRGDPTAAWMGEDDARAAAVRIFVNALVPCG
jgi:AcrR family transcriptional regulator